MWGISDIAHWHPAIRTEPTLKRDSECEVHKHTQSRLRKSREEALTTTRRYLLWNMFVPNVSRLHAAFRRLMRKVGFTA